VVAAVIKYLVGVVQYKVTPMKYFSTRGGDDLLTFEEVNRFPYDPAIPLF
jgi:hypothetical protein